MLNPDAIDQLPDEPSAPHQRSLLSCQKCHAPCALGFSDSTACASCGAQATLPRDLIAERERRREYHKERRDHDPYWVRALEVRRKWWRSPLFIAPLAFIAPFISALLGYLHGYRHERYGRAGFVWLSGIGIIHFLTSTLLESRKEELARALLLARQPMQEGGPLVCRVCAAPLSVKTDAREADRDCSCDHCGADNLIGHEREDVAPRPDLFDAEAAFREVYGDSLSQRASRLYPLTIFVGFMLLAVLTYYAVEAPRSSVP